MNTNLIKKLTLLLSLTTIVSASAGCDDSSKVKYNRENLTVLLQSDSKLDLSDTLYVFPEISKNNYYVSFICHYDSDNKVDHFNAITYKDHIDYRITYKVSKDQYEDIARFKTPSLINYFTEESYISAKSIALLRDPIEIKELKTTNETHYNKNFDESWRFNEEEYLSSSNK